MRKEEVRPNIWTEIPQDLSLWRRLACQTLLKTLDISSARAEIVPDPFKDLAILSDTTIRRSAVDVEDPKSCWKSEKKPHFCSWSKSLLSRSFSMTLQTQKED